MACAVRSSRAAWQQRSRRTSRSASAVATSPGERLSRSRRATGRHRGWPAGRPGVGRGVGRPRTGDLVEDEPAGGDQALVATDDDPVLLAREDRLDEAEPPEAPLQRVEFLIANTPGVSRVRTELVDRDLLDGEEAGRHAAYYARSSSLESGRVPKPPLGAPGYRSPRQAATFTRTAARRICLTPAAVELRER